MTRKQLAAVLALALGAATLVMAAVTAVNEFPRGVLVMALVLLALAAGWYGVRRRGIARTAAVAAADGEALWYGVRALAGIALGRDPRPLLQAHAP